jgi:large subunit ribosomal protein L19
MAAPDLPIPNSNAIVPVSMKNTVVVSPIDMEARKSMDLRAGDTVRVWQKIEEKGKYRLQAFEGLVLARKHGTEAGGTFTVRRVASGVGVEKIFPLYSPMIDKIEIVKRSRVRRAKLYYIREKVAREARRLLRRTRIVHAKPAGDTAVEEVVDVNAIEAPEVSVEA